MCQLTSLYEKGSTNSRLFAVHLLIQLYTALDAREIVVAVFEIRVSESPAMKSVRVEATENITPTHMQPFRDLELCVR